MKETTLTTLTTLCRQPRPLVIARGGLLAALVLVAVALPVLTPAVAADECPWCDDRPAAAVLDQPCDYCDEPGDADTTCWACQVAADADGLTDDEALDGADPANPDSDFDGIADGDEVAPYDTWPWTWDTDGDAVGDARELFGTGTDPLNRDSDGDGYSDSEELYRYLTGPNNYDSYPSAQGRRK